MEYNKKNAKRWSIIGERPSFGLAVYEFAKENKNILVVAADVISSAGLDRMKTDIPEQVINVGIAEQNMMGIATGLSSEGFIVFTTSFAPFQAMRCLEQIRVNQGYMQQKVIMVGLASGVAYGELGHTHCCIEDVSLLRSIPNIAVVVPADCMEVVKAVEAAISYPKSIYIRLMDKTNVPIVYDSDYDFQIGKAVPIIKDGMVTVLANGTMVHFAAEAAKLLKKEHNIDVAVYDFHTVKPIDFELLEELEKQSKAILTVEEHNIIGGLGSAVAEFYSDRINKIPVYKMGIKDEYCHGASHDTILEKYDLTLKGIYNKLLNIMEELL